MGSIFYNPQFTSTCLGPSRASRSATVTSPAVGKQEAFPGSTGTRAGCGTLRFMMSSPNSRLLARAYIVDLTTETSKRLDPEEENLFSGVC
jgi:hypothetical protein